MKFIKPQLARSWVERRDANILDMPGFTMEPKLDGHRVAVIRHGKGVSLVSRRGKQVQEIPWLITWAQRQLEPGTYIDGELVAPTSGDSSHNVHSLRARNPQLLSYVAFDMLYDKGQALHQKMWHQRHVHLLRASPVTRWWPEDDVLEESGFYVICSYPRNSPYYVTGAWPPDPEPIERRRKRAELWVERGFEGVMYKDMFAPYKPNSRSGWIKEKVTQTVEAIVVSCDGKPSEWRVRPGKTGTDGILYHEGRHTDPWLAGHVNLEYGYGPYPATHFMQPNIVDVPGVGLCTVAGSLGVTGPVDKMRELVGQVVTLKCWGVYPTGAVRHPSPQKYRDWDGKHYTPPSPTENAV